MRIRATLRSLAYRLWLLMGAHGPAIWIGGRPFFRGFAQFVGGVALRFLERTESQN